MVVKSLDNVDVTYSHHKTSGVSLMARKGPFTHVYASFHGDAKIPSISKDAFWLTWWTVGCFCGHEPKSMVEGLDRQSFSPDGDQEAGQQEGVKKTPSRGTPKTYLLYPGLTSQ